MSHNIVPGTTVRGPFTAKNTDNRSVTLIDKHLVVVQIQGDMAMCMYSGTDDSSFRGLPGYVPVTQAHNKLAGWKETGKFYCDAAQFCIVPVGLLEVEGRVSSSVLATLVGRTSSLKSTRVQVTKYDASASERVTGVARQLKSGIAIH